MTTKPDLPAAKGFPAPLVLPAGLVAGWLLQRAHPLPAPAAAARWGVGGLLVALGLPFGLGALRAMRRAGTGPNPYRPTRALVTGGPFAISRHPMYVSLAFYYAGLSVLLGLTWALALLPFAIAVIHFGSAVPEERYLLERFGDEYRAYRARVRPWL